MNAPARVLLTRAEADRLCLLCGVDVFGHPKTCTCTYTCLTCRRVRAGALNHSDGKCPNA